MQSDIVADTKCVTGFKSRSYFSWALRNPRTLFCGESKELKGINGLHKLLFARFIEYSGRFCLYYNLWTIPNLPHHWCNVCGPQRALAIIFKNIIWKLVQPLKTFMLETQLKLVSLGHKSILSQQSHIRLKWRDTPLLTYQSHFSNNGLLFHT